MIKFRQKEYTIQEGHYTGPKSIKKIPGTVKIIVKSVLAGMGIGAGIGALSEEMSVGETTKKGAKTGFWAGVALKILINKFHKPMSSVKFQKVDKAIRKEFGIREVSGMIVNDTRKNRDELNSHFAFNDPNISDFKVNISIQKKKLTLYTFGLEKNEMKSLNESLDYYCYKYYGMEYSSRMIDHKDNSYSVTIVFTNYDAIAKFLVEISDSLKIRVNVLDGDLDLSKLSEVKMFSSSLPMFDKYDILKILGKGGTIFGQYEGIGRIKSGSEYLMDSLSESLTHLGKRSLSMNSPRGFRVKRKILTNAYLERAFKDLGLMEGFDYTVKKNDNPLNLYIHEGYLFICSALTGKNEVLMKKIAEKFKLVITNVKGRATIFTYIITSGQDLERLLREIIKLSVKPNIYTR